MRISDWSSDVCSSDLSPSPLAAPVTIAVFPSSLPISEYLQSGAVARRAPSLEQRRKGDRPIAISVDQKPLVDVAVAAIISRRAGGEKLARALRFFADRPDRSEEHTSELQSLMRISYAVFCLKKKTK